MRPRQIEDAVREMPILIFSDEAQCGVARFRHAGCHVDRRRLLRLEGHPMPDRDDRIEHRALAAGQPSGVEHRLRRGDRAPAADERHAVRLEGNVQRIGPVDGHQVKHPGRRLVVRAGPARAQDGLPLRDDLGLHEEIGERRMQRVGGSGREHDFRVAGDLDRAPRSRAVGDAEPAQLDVVFGRNDDFGMRLEIVVAPAKFGARFGEYRFVVRRARRRRLMRGRPEVAAGRVADVAERPPVVAGAVFAPAGDGEVLPAAAPAARVRDHDVVAAVRQQLHFRYRRVGAGENAHGRFRAARNRAYRGQLGGMRIERCGLRDALLQQQQGRLEQRVRFEALLHRTLEQQMGEREQDHALVMRHERTHDGARPVRAAGARACSRWPRTGRIVRRARRRRDAAG